MRKMFDLQDIKISVYDDLKVNMIVIKNRENKKINLYLNGLDDYLEIDKNNCLYLFKGLYTNEILKCLKMKDYSYNFIYDL